MKRKLTFMILAMLFALLSTNLAWGEDYTNKEISFKSSTLETGWTTNGTFNSSYYKMTPGQYAQGTSTALFGTDVLSTDMTINIACGTFGTWTGNKSVKVKAIFYDSKNIELTSVEKTYTGLNSTQGTYRGEMTLSKPSNPSEIAYLKIIFSDFTTGNDLRFAGVKLTYSTQTAGPIKTLTSIAISGTPNKTTYEAGEEFDPAGLVVTGTYDDESQETITSGITWNVTPNPLTAGTTSVSVTATVSEITSAAYVVNDLTVNQHIVTPGIYDIFLNNALYGISTGNNATEQSVTTHDITVISGCTSSASSKTYYDANHIRYYADSYLKLSVPFGYEITSVVFTADGTWNGRITSTPDTYNADTKTWSGNSQTVDFAFGAQNRASKITVTFVAKKTLQSIAVKTPPTKTTYNVGENFDPAGLVITATYDEGDPEDIAYAGNESKFTFNPTLEIALTKDNNNVNITYGGKSVDQEITVNLIQLETPTNLAATNIASTIATLTWYEVENASSYEVKLNGVAKTATTNSLLVEDLNESTTYTWTVKAIGDGTTYADSEASAESNFTTLDPPSDPYTVTFNAGTNGTCSTTELTEAEAGAGVTLPGVTPNAGYQFVGWATSETATEANAGEAGKTYYPTENITLYAVYNEVYTINYMVNGANTNPQINVPMGTALVFPEVSAPDADHVFRGWVTEAIEGTTDTEPAYVNTTDLTATQNITYYAVFAEKSGSEPAEQKTQTLQYDTWTYYGSTTDKDTYRLFHSGSYIESAEFDLSKLSKVIVYGGSFGGSSYNSLTIGDGTNTWKSVTVSGSSQTGTNTYTDGTPLSGTGKLRVTSNSGTASGTGVRISKVEIFTMEGGYTYSNFCTTVVTKILTSISLSGEYPTEFWKGDAFSHEGMIVTAHYNDGSTKDVTSSATFSTPNMTTVGEQTVTVTYDTKSTTYSITVKNIANTQETAYTVTEAKSLIDANPAELATTEVYVKGTISQVDSYNSTYHSITYWISEDGTTTNQFEVYSGKNLNNTDFASKDDVKVGDDVVVYGIIKKFNSTYEFDKNNYIVSHVKASTLSIDDITVEIGETITPEITTNVPDEYIIAYSVASEDVVKVDNGNLVTVAVGGPVEVTATLTAEGYKEATTTFEVEVIKSLTSISVKIAPTTVSYKAGDKFDPTGLVITANYNDESTEDVAYAGNEDKFTFTPSLETPLTKENTSVTITYAGKEATQTITVRELYTYDITWMANGEPFKTTQVTEGDALVLPETNPANVGDMVFQGWINTENYYDAETAPEYIVPSEIIPEANATYYAVFAKEVEVESTKEYSLLPNDFEGGSYSANDGEKEINGATLVIKDVYKNTYIQLKASSGSLYNKYALGKKITSVVVSVKTNSVKVYEGSANDSWTEVTGSNGTYTFSDNKAYFKVTSTSSYAQVNSITVNYIGKTTNYSNFCTTVAPIVISENTVWDGNVTINGNTTVTIESDAVLTVNGALTNTNAANLIIEDGAQLILNEKNIGVMATVKKQIEANNTHTGKPVDKWYTIGSPVKEPIINGSTGNYVADIIPAGGMSALTYDLYYLDMTAGTWINYRQEGDTPGFTTLENGRGYIYSNQSATTVKYVGELNTANVNRSVNTGWNLVSNPFAQTIAFSNFELDNSASMVGYYSLDGAGGWQAEPITTVVASNTGILVNVPEGASSIEISKPAEAIENNGAKRGDSNDNAYAYIEINVANANYSDRAYAAFAEGYGLPKYDHINAEIQKVYIPQDGEDFAIAFMDMNTTVFPLNFKAMTTGSYSISLKATDNISTLVLVDNQTGTETNMLLEESYKFIGSPADNDNRFTVKLSISHNDGQSDSEHFVYQNGSELVVNGEGTLQIFDVLGRVVISEEVHGQTVNVGGLNTGAYIVRLTGESVKTQKIVVR